METYGQNRELSDLNKIFASQSSKLKGLNRSTRYGADKPFSPPQLKVGHLGADLGKDYRVDVDKYSELPMTKLTIRQQGHLSRMEELDYLKEKLSAKRVDFKDVKDRVPGVGLGIGRTRER